MVCTFHELSWFLTLYIPRIEAALSARQYKSDKAWVYTANQLGRLNLSPDDFRLFVERLYNSRKIAVGSSNQYSAKRHNDGKQNIADDFAIEHGTSSRTVERAGKQAEGIFKGSVK